jgi:hypothetical protein
VHLPCLTIRIRSIPRGHQSSSRLLRGWDPNRGVGRQFDSCDLGAEAYRLQTGLLPRLSDEAEKVLVVHFIL